jgi:hypothetical protein
MFIVSNYIPWTLIGYLYLGRKFRVFIYYLINYAQLLVTKYVFLLPTYLAINRLTVGIHISIT